MSAGALQIRLQRREYVPWTKRIVVLLLIVKALDDLWNGFFASDKKINRMVLGDPTDEDSQQQ
jgi:hypothetical protein